MENKQIMENSGIPSKVFDMEYSTQKRAEFVFLKEHGFEPTFVHFNKEYGVRTYKYKKTKELFKALTEFYK